jgi:hypothetical protein
MTLRNFWLDFVYFWQKVMVRNNFVTTSWNYPLKSFRLQWATFLLFAGKSVNLIDKEWVAYEK